MSFNPRPWLFSFLLLVSTGNDTLYKMPAVKMADAKSLTEMAESRGIDNVIEDCDDAMFFSNGQIDGKEYSINGARINKSMYLAVICDETSAEVLPTSDVTKLAEIYGKIFLRRAHIHRNKKLGYPEDHLRVNKENPEYLETLKAIKRNEK